MFDRLVEGIQVAAGQAGYSFDRARLPWQVENHGTTEIRQVGDRWLVGQENSLAPTEPGLLIFRKHEPAGILTNGNKEDQYLAILLVGENPTAGIHATQFKKALRVAECVGHLVGIIGPNFSGSFVSLNRLLEQDREGCETAPPSRKHALSFVIRSGSATASAEIEWFRQRNLEKHVNVMSFAYSGEYVNCAFRDFAVKQHFRLQEIATLAEDETVYGYFGNTATKSSDQCCPATDNRSNSDSEPVELNFPRGISTLRSAYQDELALSAGANPTNPPRTTLRPDLSITGEDDDTVPAFVPNQISLSQEAVLQEIFRTLRYHHTKIVLIKATDVMDTLFLAGQLQREYPEARLVSYGADLLARRDVDDPTLRGVMALTAYPLLPGWVTEIVGKPDVHHIYPTMEQVGESNATLDTILETEADQPVLEGSLPESIPAADYAEYVSPSADGLPMFQLERPSLWLTAVGRDGYWPISVINPNPLYCPAI
jgi:hypothetical protein